MLIHPMPINPLFNRTSLHSIIQAKDIKVYHKMYFLIQLSYRQPIRNRIVLHYPKIKYKIHELTQYFKVLYLYEEFSYHECNLLHPTDYKL